ncbi:dual OB domain-containing protein [Ruminococcus sp.]|uniref:dual OB domain-containing protein n=1 Tax=Ruminococcus sp. TaxID=41978 RepID=UPI0026EF910A|nr:hypothetical protein [Ruminococcus bromii]
MRKEILIMTKSAKINGFCVAGIDISNGRWIRLVSDDENGEGAVSREDLTFQNGMQAEIFDLVAVECKYFPTEAQSENYLYDNQFYWEKIRAMNREEAFSECPLNNSQYIFENSEKSIDENEITGESLVLVEIEHIVISVVNEYEKKKWKVDFEYNGVHYSNISIGDISIRNEYNGYGIYQIQGRHKAVFSLTGRYERTGKYYKMLAQLF